MKKLFLLSVLLLPLVAVHAKEPVPASPLDTLPGTLPATVAISPAVRETYGHYLKHRLVLPGTYGLDFDWLIASHDEPHLRSRWGELVEYGAARWRHYYGLQQKANRSTAENTALQEFAALVESNLKYLEALTPESKKLADQEAAQRSARRVAAAEAERLARAYENLANSPGELRKFLGEMSQRYPIYPAKAQATPGLQTVPVENANTAKNPTNSTNSDDLVKLALLQAAQNQRIIELLERLVNK